MDASLWAKKESMLCRRAAACWVRQATQQCYAMSPRPCTVFITADSDEVRHFFSPDRICCKTAATAVRVRSVRLRTT